MAREAMKPIVLRIATRKSAGKLDLPIVLYDGEDGFTVAEVPVLPGCISQGKTEEEAIRNIREAAELCLESMEEEGWTLPGNASVGHIEVSSSDA